jgi:ketosteroid isomerase-like protein
VDKADVERTVEQWRGDWQSKNFDAFMSHYATHFSGSTARGRMNRTQWATYKADVFRRATSIRITISHLTVTVNGTTAKAVFKQTYQGSGRGILSDYGTTTLDFSREGDQWLIVREDWVSG